MSPALAEAARNTRSAAGPLDPVSVLIVGMPSLSRRGFLQAAAVSSTAGLLASAKTKTLQTVGVQLYTVRDVLPKDPLQTLKTIAEIGYREVEVIGATIPQIEPALKATNLKAVSAHLDSDLFLAKHQDELAKAVDELKSHHIEYAVFPYLPPQRRGGPDVYHRLAEDLNAAGKRCHHAGVKLCYHNHAFEFKPMGSVTPLQILMKETDPALLNLELDVFWVSVAGHDPVAMLTTYASRIALVHLKDKAEGTPVQFNENVPEADFKEVGSGSLHFAAILRAATQAGVKHFFVEQDHTPGDPLASLRKSYDYLHKLEF